MTSFCEDRNNFFAHLSEQLPTLAPFLSSTMASLLTAHASESQKWSRSVDIPREFSADDINIISDAQETLSILCAKEEDEFSIKVKLPTDVIPDSLTTKYIGGKVIISGHRRPNEIDTDLIRAQTETWIQDAQELMSGLHGCGESAYQSSSEKKEESQQGKGQEEHTVETSVDGYHPDELTVVAKGQKVTVTGYHCKKNGDEEEEIRFKRSFDFPVNADLKKLQWKVNASKKLVITAPVSKADQYQTE